MIRVNEWFGIDMDCHEYQLLYAEKGTDTRDMEEVSRHKTLKDACDACYREMMVDLFLENDPMSMREAISKISNLKASISDLFWLAQSEAYE